MKKQLLLTIMSLFIGATMLMGQGQYNGVAPQQCNNNNPGTSEFLDFANAPGNATSTGTLQISAIGDLGSSSSTSTEHVDYYNENNVLIGSSVGGSNCVANVFNYTMSQADVNAFGTDGKITIEVRARSGVNVSQCSSQIGTAAFCADGTLDYTYVTFANDAGVTSIDSPSVFCDGAQNVVATIRNLGNNQITGITINWMVGTTLQTAVVDSTMMLDTAKGVGSASAQVVLGSYTFTAGVTENIQAWTSNPNNVTDGYQNNDSTSGDFQPSLSGNFTIDALGSGGSNYVSMSDAINDLNTYGVCGSVNFDVATGTYTEQVTLGTIVGASSTNTITFTADTAGVTVEYGATGSTDNWVFKMNGTQWVTFDGFTFQNASSGSNSYRALSFLDGGSSNNTIMNCVFNGYGTTSSSTNLRGWTTNSAGNNYNKFMNNEFNDGGYYGFYFRGGGTGATNIGNEFDGNLFDGAYYYATYFYYSTEMKFNNNTIVHNSISTSTGYGLYMYYQYGYTEVTGNDIDYRYYAMRLYYWYGNENNRSVVANNMVHSGLGNTTAYGMYLYGLEYVDVVHNTTWTNSGSTSTSYGIYMSQGTKNRILNNSVFVPQGNSGNYGIYISSANVVTDTSGVDHNNVWAPTMNHGYYGGAKADLTAWKASGLGNNGYDADPGYTDKDSMYSCHDSLDNRGRGMENVMFDFQGDNRDPSTPDIGADEFIGNSTYSAGPDGLLCNGSDIFIGSQITGSTYLWNTSETTGRIMVNTAGDYTVSVFSGCGGSFTDVVTVTDNTPDAVFTYRNSYFAGVFENKSNTNGDMWRWVFYNGNDPIDTVWTTSQKDVVFLFEENGPHNVCLTTYNECDTVETCSEWIGTVGVNETNLNSDISLMPNPVSDILTVKLNNFVVDRINVEMVNIQGQIVYTDQFVNVNATDSKTIDVSNFNSGIYIVRFTSEDKVITKRIIVE